MGWRLRSYSAVSPRWPSAAILDFIEPESVIQSADLKNPCQEPNMDQIWSGWDATFVEYSPLNYRTKLFENWQSYPYTVSDKNVAQGT